MPRACYPHLAYGHHVRAEGDVAFDLEPPSEAYSEMRVVLEYAGQPASETWLYRWTA